jgi:molecular chaperone HscB
MVAVSLSLDSRMNYFEFYELPVSFVIDNVLVKKKFFELSKKYHPDFYVTKDPEKQREMLDLSTFNTKAFEVLTDFDKRIKYILELKHLIYEGERYELPAGFLMDMMEINEGLMELQVQPDTEKLTAFRLHVADLFDQLYEEARPVIELYDDTTESPESLKTVKDYYYKKKYLLRIQESLNTFAARS